MGEEPLLLGHHQGPCKYKREERGPYDWSLVSPQPNLSVGAKSLNGIYRNTSENQLYSARITAS